MLKYKKSNINADVWGNHIGLNVIINFAEFLQPAFYCY